MDEQNQIPNSNMSFPGQNVGQTPPPVGGAMPAQQMPAKAKSMLLWVIVVIALVAAGVAWWYIKQMMVEPVVQEPAINQEAREDMMMNAEIQGTDSADIDSEFNSIDNDINSL